MKTKFIGGLVYRNLNQKCADRLRAFTRTDLLAVIAVCGVLLPLMIVASQKSDEDIRRMQCRNNLRQIGMWLANYAADYDDLLPVNNRPTGAAWDVNRDLLTSATAYGAPPENFYCPSGNWSESSVPFEFFGPNYAVIDYILAVSGTPNLYSTNINSSIIPEPITNRDGTYLPKVSERELAADVVISGSSGRFYDIINGTVMLLRTSHMTDFRPAGGNILYLDGHVEWRDFGDGMVRRTSFVPTFWY